MSVYQDILTAVKTVISALSLAGFPTTVVRKKPYVDKHDVLGMVCISPGNEIIAEEYSDNLVNMDYPVYITFITAGNGVINVQATDPLLNARQAVRRALNKPSLSGVSSVIDTKAFMSRAFNSDIVGVNYDASQLTLIFKSTEAREA